jgi:hypothetical protein
MIKLVATAVAFHLLSPGAMAHDAPSGWSYPFNCCSDQDCREVPDLKETAAGYVTKSETIPFTDKRVKNSPDGKFHLCTVAGEDGGRVLCLFAPPKGY